MEPVEAVENMKIMENGMDTYQIQILQSELHNQIVKEKDATRLLIQCPNEHKGIKIELQRQIVSCRENILQLKDAIEYLNK